MENKNKLMDITDKKNLESYLQEIANDFSDLKRSISNKKFGIAKHYSIGINSLSNYITEILKKYE